MYRFTNLHIVAGPEEARAASLFAEEITLRTNVAPSILASPLPKGPYVCFAHDDAMGRDEFALALDKERPALTVKAKGIRGFIYGYSYFLRKTTYIDGQITLICDVSGKYSPHKPIRGHQLGYRPKNNTYDAWTPAHYARYYRDMMAFGSNICELMPPLTDDKVMNELMKLPPEEMLIACSALADELDLDVSVWYPNVDDLTVEEAAERRKELLSKLPRVDVIFPPGGDPGDYPADEFVERCIATARKVREVHPQVQMWPSAQRPKRIRNWGEHFIEQLEALPPEIDGVITGPNRAFDIEELRRRLPMQYPIRLYPDITHNVRCEWPVHFPRDDWHFAFAATMGRESINPRPLELRDVWRLFDRYTCGSVSYSEGSNDDINKMVWGWLEYAPDTPVPEILEDYARYFFPGADAEQVAAGILALEKNWYGDPAENPLIETTLSLWEDLAEKHPALMQNWRFVMCLFRARGDAVIRRRRVFENKLVAKAKKILCEGGESAIERALEVLETPYPESYQALRASLFDLAQMLFDTIGIQLDVAHFKASAPDRGAVLDTIDQPITDRKYLVNRLSAMKALPAEEKQAALAEFLAHDALHPDEFVFSVAVDGMERFGGKPVDAYLNFRGDSPIRNNGQIPMSLVGLYDHFFFKAEIGGFLPGQDYELLIVTSEMLKKEGLPPTDFVVKANGREVFRGDYTSLTRDEEYERKWLTDAYCAVKVDLPADVFENGCLLLEMYENRVGVEFAELRITRKK